MSIKSPATYADWYWKNYVEAQSAFDDQLEVALSPHAAQIISGSGMTEFLPDWLKPIFTQLQQPPSAGYGDILGRFVSEAADSVVGNMLGAALQDFGYSMNGFFRDTRIDFPTASILYQRKAIDQNLYESRMISAGYKEAEGAAMYLSQLPYPSIPDIMLYARYHGNPENTKGIVWDFFDVSERDYDLWEWQTLQRMTTPDVQTLYRRGYLNDNEYYNELLQIGWQRSDIEKMTEVGWSLPNAMLLVQGNLLNDVEDEKILIDISRADIHPEYAQTYLDGVLTKPSTSDLISYLLRKDPDLTNLDQQLRRLGVHSAYSDVYRTLANPIPPVADIITMAVREAFTPAIAERFGQYEDFPPQFEEFAAQKGLTKDWAMRYWAAHWNLPSPSQGFEMLHRGVIDVDTLDFLLRAQDVMPFWRDKLVAIAYRPLTRVDVRRMYKEGVLDEADVYQAYQAAGYSDQNAERMAEFTIRQTLSSLSKFSSADIVKAYVNRSISKSEAGSLLREIGIRTEDASYILSTADYKRQWELESEQLKGIKNLYKKQVYDENQTRDKLSGLNLPAEQINALMQQWYYEVKGEAVATWTTAQTLSFLKKNIITRDRAIRELQLNGYDQEHINVYLYSPPETVT